jgi:glycosyltransferase 2 family protein
VDVLTPWGGAAGLALIVDDTTRRGHPAARATAGLILQLVADFAALTLILVAGMIYLSLTHHLEVYVIVGACILLLITLGMGTALLLGLWKPVILRRLLAWFQGLLNFIARRFKRSNFLAEDWSEEFSCEYIAASSALRCYPNRLARTLGTMLIVHASSIVCLYILFLAFYQPVNLDILLAGYSVEFVFWIISLVPQGIGLVEGSLVLVFTSLGVPLDAAVVVSVAFRGMTFWLPLGLGFLSLRQIKTFEGV